MKTLLALAAAFATAFSAFSDELIEKYSIEVMNEGNPGT